MRDMGPSTSLYIALPVALAFFAVLAKFGFDMKRDGQPVSMWGYFFGSLVPLAAVAVLWATQVGVDAMGRNLVLGVIGAAAGAAGLIWAGYLVAASQKTLSSKSAALKVPNTIRDISNNSGIITQGQSGDNSQ